MESPNDPGYLFTYTFMNNVSDIRYYDNILITYTCVCVVSVAPPPPPVAQLTPQIPLTGFVARVQENSKQEQDFIPYLYKVVS